MRLLVLALIAGGCSDGGATRPLAGERTCRIEYRDGSERVDEHFVVPLSVFRDRPGVRWKKIECAIPLDGAFLRTLDRPAVLLGRLGTQGNARLSAWFEGSELPESRRNSGMLVPVPLPTWDPSRDPVLTVRVEASGQLFMIGDPWLWAVGEQRALWRRLLSHAAPDLAISILLSLIGVLSLVAGLAYRRSDPTYAVRFAMLAGFCICFAITRLADNPLVGFSHDDARVLLFWLRGPLGIAIIPLYIELLRRHFELPMRWWMWLFLALSSVSFVFRVAALTGVALAFFNWTNIILPVGVVILARFAVRGARDRRPGSRLLAAGMTGFFVTGFMRGLSLMGFSAVPDIVTWGLFVMTSCTISATIVAAAANRSRLARAQALSRFVPESLVRRILDGEPVPRQERRRLTIFFSDLRGFTQLSDRIEPEVLTAVLGEYLTAMVDIARKHGGTIDKFIGDAVMVFFGAPDPTSDERGALACVAMAVEMQLAMPALNARWLKLGLDQPLLVRMGINTGFATVGEFGSLQRSDYTAIGSSVNLAQRLESHCPPGKVLISQAVEALVKEGFACAPTEPIVPKGYDRPIAVWVVDPCSSS